MSDKRDVDALLRGWPAIGADGKAIADEADASWDAKAEAIVAAAKAAPSESSGIEALLAPPDLRPEPGESSSIVRVRPGEVAMSESGSNPPPPKAGERKRQSLKEMAERASQSVRPPPVTSAGPESGRSSSPGLGRASTPPVSTPTPPVVKRAAEAGKDDSGVVNLKLVSASATPEQVASAEKAKPGQASLFEDDAPASSKGAKAPAAAKSTSGAAKPASKDPPASGKPVAIAKLAKVEPAAEKKGGGNGPLVGFIVAIVGIAAGVLIWQMRKGADITAATPTKDKPAVTEVAQAVETSKPEPSSAPTAVAGNHGLDVDTLPEGKAAPSAKPIHGAAVAKEAAEAAMPSAAATASAVAIAAAPPMPIGSSGDLKTEMRKAVGADGQPITGSGDTEPAAGDARSKTLPERPSQGAVQGAIGAVLSNAKACCAGAEEATRAIITFAPNGTVTNVSVAGWAALNGQSGCVVSALKAARVAPFTDPKYTFPVTFRP